MELYKEEKKTSKKTRRINNGKRQWNFRVYILVHFMPIKFGETLEFILQLGRYLGKFRRIV